MKNQIEMEDPGFIPFTLPKHDLQNYEHDGDHNGPEDWPMIDRNIFFMRNLGSTVDQSS
jgi:hypothetical protein